MYKKFIIDTFVWGVILWLTGYVLGIVLFMAIPHSLIGWTIMPIGIAITLWVLLKRIKSNSLKYYFVLGVVWSLIALALDYFLLVKVFNPPDGYYKLDVYIYYLSTFSLPLIVGWIKILKSDHFLN